MSGNTQLMSYSAQPQAGLLDPAEFLKNIPIKFIIENKVKHGFNLVSLPENTPVLQAMKILGDNNFQAVPVTSSTGQYLGFLTQIELVNFCLSVSMDASIVEQQSVAQHGDLACASRDVERLKQKGAEAFSQTTIGSLVGKASKQNWLPMASPWLVIDCNETVFDACERFFSKGYRRIAVIDSDENVCGILTQSDIIQLLSRSAEARPEEEPLGIFQRMTLDKFLGSDFQRAKDLLVTISWSAPVIHAFYMMFEKNVPCIVVLDEKGLPMSVVTASDVRRFNENNLDFLLKTLGSFTCGYDSLQTGPPVCVSLKDKAGDAFSRMQLYGIHQILLVSDENQAMGVVPMQLLINPIVRLEQERRAKSATSTASKSQQQQVEVTQTFVESTKREVYVEAGGEESQLPIPTNS